MTIYIRRCKKCDKAYDMMSCPNYNQKRIKEIWRRKNETPPHPKG